MDNPSGTVNFQTLMDSIVNSSEASTRVEPNVEGDALTLIDRPPTRRIMTYVICMLLIGLMVSINFMTAIVPRDQARSKASNSDNVFPINTTFSTYYKGKYELCQKADKIQLEDGTFEERPEHCWRGNMDVTMLFKELAIDSYVKVYLVFALDVPYSGAWWKFWKSTDGFTTSTRNGKLYFGLSGMESNRNIGHLLLNGLSPSICPTRPKGLFKEYWARNAVKQAEWNEFGGRGPICSCNASVTYPIPSRNQISFRDQDDFYFMGLRKYIFSDFEHVADLDFSVFNPFNAFSGHETNFKYSKGAEAGRTVDDLTSLETKKKDMVANDIAKNDDSSSPIFGEFQSSECGIVMTFNGEERDMSEFDVILLRFSLLFIVKSLIECLLLCRQFKRVDEEAQGQSISIICLSMLSYQEILEVFLLLYHGSAYQTALFCFGLMMFIKFFLLAIVEHSFIVLIWRANHVAQIREGWTSTQKRFVLFYRYYFSFILLQLVIWYFYYSCSPWILIISYTFWLPQILLDVWRGQCCSLSYLFIVGMSICRLTMPLYLFLVDNNAFTFDVFSIDYATSNAPIGLSIALIVLLQIILISLQRLHGPRCFFTCSILPQIYDYVRPWTKMMEDDPQECVICMYDIVHSKSDWCITPCDHLFHTKCLKEWTSIKLECPNCRRMLPPIA